MLRTIYGVGAGGGQQGGAAAQAKKRMIMENEVNKEAIKVMKIDSVLATIKQHEEKMEAEVSTESAKHLIALYNKAVEYYSALNDDRHL